MPALLMPDLVDGRVNWCNRYNCQISEIDGIEDEDGNIIDGTEIPEYEIMCERECEECPYGLALE
jgi:hypothetical protein